MQPAFSFSLKRVLQLALYVIVRPSEYFRTMPRSGPLVEPMYFSAVIGLVSGLIAMVLDALLSDLPFSLISLLLVPGLVIGAVFIVAGIFFLLWKLLGSRQGYGVAFRITAATLAISPITAVLAFVPYVGLLVNVVWTMLLLIIASVEVHGIGRRKATIAFTMLGVVLAGSAMWMHALQSTLEQQLRELGVTPAEFNQMSPQEREQVLQQLQRQLQGTGTSPL
ncbi:hypothetical protein AAV94_09315 [Lampropedia cohaerens]|uniref:Yip1 domain-containing protein n=1 Tax=Lampropedia cohaerens TaxID=1610491 RepID=A0A0U1PZM2_9BURK|nr:YIP1 family protein [Lampropedia cohaerens]KKW67805.1 hypothetical protein AAV94_09315 [Lampropedia cohaerens]